MDLLWVVLTHVQMDDFSLPLLSLSRSDFPFLSVSFLQDFLMKLSNIFVQSFSYSVLTNIVYFMIHGHYYSFSDSEVVLSVVIDQGLLIGISNYAHFTHH